MNEPQDPNETVERSSTPADSLDAGLAAGFGRRVDGPASVLSALGPPWLGAAGAYSRKRRARARSS